MPGWTVTSSNIDWVDGGYWEVHGGRRSLDLAGSPGAGQVGQTIATTSGGRYELRFSLAGNPQSGCHVAYGDAYLKAVHVSAGEQAATYSHDVSGYVDRSVDFPWDEKTLDFTAWGTTADITFTSGQSGCAGPIIDDVSVVQLDTAPPNHHGRAVRRPE